MSNVIDFNKALYEKNWRPIEGALDAWAMKCDVSNFQLLSVLAITPRVPKNLKDKARSILIKLLTSKPKEVLIPEILAVLETHKGEK
jgi:hypothetical protein